MFRLYRIVKRSVAEIVPAQCEQQQMLCCIAKYVSFRQAEQISPTPEQKLLRKKCFLCEQEPYPVHCR